MLECVRKLRVKNREEPISKFSMSVHETKRVSLSESGLALRNNQRGQILIQSAKAERSSSHHKPQAKDVPSPEDHRANRST